jgi:hypothetical protein
MTTVRTDFTIEQTANGFVVKGKGYYQDVDFVQGGLITSQARAEVIRDLLVEQANQPRVDVVTTEMEVAAIKERQDAADAAILMLMDLGMMG